MNHSTPNIGRYRRLSKPTPPEREGQTKKPNMTSSPSATNQYTLNLEQPHGYVDPRLQTYIQQSPIPHNPSSFLTSPPPAASFALQSSDINNIVTQLKGVLREEIHSTIHALLQVEVEKAVKSAVQPIVFEIKGLKAENELLRDQIDSLEQYGRGISCDLVVLRKPVARTLLI